MCECAAMEQWKGRCGGEWVGGRLCGACSRFGFEGAVCPELPVFLRFGC
jgi:hypothetical protein